MTNPVLNLADEPRMLDVVRRCLAAADDVYIAVSFTRCSGLGLLIDPLKELARRGGRAQILTSTYMSVTQPAALESLLSLPSVETRIQHGSVGLHTKFWWFGSDGGGECWAGSSNLSKGGLTTNLEWNLRSIETADLERTRAQFNQLWTRSDVSPISDEFIKGYRQIYKDGAGKGQQSDFSFIGEEPGTVTPNQAQKEALAQLAALRDRGERRAAVIAATGVGKTYLAAFDIAQSGASNILYVSHRLEHLTQAHRAFKKILGLTHSLGIVSAGHDQQSVDVVFVTVASLKNRPALAARQWDYLLIDEFHHVQADSYQVLKHIRERAFLLGITATPERQDGRDVLEWCDWNVAYEVRLTEAIDRGWLLPFHYFGIADETVDFLQIPWRNLKEVESALSVSERVNHVLQEALERGYDGLKRATVGFCAGREHALYMAKEFNRRGYAAEAVLGDVAVAKREEIYNRLANVNDPLEWIFVADVLNEGVDIPSINSVLFLRPTESAALFLQQLGRGLRLCDDTEVLTVLDFVGHHRSAWLTLEALHDPSGGGRRSKVTDDFVIKPPKACEVVLQRRTREILAKVSRFKTKKAECDEAYQRLHEELGRQVRPIDLWNRNDVPTFAEFRAAYKSWLNCQEANDDTPDWAQGLARDHLVRAFLSAVDNNWQAQRVGPYAMLWGLGYSPDDPDQGFRQFFETFPHWQRERAALDKNKVWGTLEKKLGTALVNRRIVAEVRKVLGGELSNEIEGRILYTLAGDYQTRHGGILRTPSDLNLFAEYTRPEIVRHFGVHFDPAKHNKGILWFDDQGVIITKLDTSGSVERHHYINEFLSPIEFFWTSQNQMQPTNNAGRKLLDAAAEKRTVRLFVQPRSHKPALYLGRVKTASFEGSGPMQIKFELEKPMPALVLAELGVTFLDD